MIAEKSCWEELLRKAAEKSCWEELLRRAAEKGCWEELLRRAAKKSCWEELLRKAAEKICWEELLRRAAEKGCWEKLLRRAAEKSCWERLLRKSAEKSCWDRCSSKMLLLCKISSFLFRRVGLVGRGSSDAQNCGEMQIFHVAERPLTQKVIVGRPKLWWNANFSRRRATLNAKSDRRTPKTVVKCKFLSSPKQHLTQKVIVGRPKLWWNANSLGARATLSSLRARRTSKTVVKCKFFRRRCNPFVTSCWSCGETIIFLCRGRLPTPCACFIQFCARCCSETYILTFWMARRCSETQILILPEEPSRRIRWVDRAKLWRNVNFELLESLRALAWACERFCFVSARLFRALHLLSQSFEYGRPRKFASRIGR